MTRDGRGHLQQALLRRLPRPVPSPTADCVYTAAGPRRVSMLCSTRGSLIQLVQEQPQSKAPPTKAASAGTAYLATGASFPSIVTPAPRANHHLAPQIPQVYIHT
jgi:hypothetical protein